MLQNWFELNEKIRFIILGSFNMSVRYLLFISLSLILPISHYQIILLLTWILSSFIAFYSYKKLVFQSNGDIYKEFIISLIIWIFSYIINAILLEIFIHLLKIPPYLAQAIAIIIIFIINYQLFKHYAFKEKKKWWQKLFY